MIWPLPEGTSVIAWLVPRAERFTAPLASTAKIASPPLFKANVEVVAKVSVKEPADVMAKLPEDEIVSELMVIAELIVVVAADIVPPKIALPEP